MQALPFLLDRLARDLRLLANEEDGHLLNVARGPSGAKRNLLCSAALGRDFVCQPQPVNQAVHE